MEKKFTRAMVCEEFKSTCGKCPLHSSNNPKSLPCWLLNESDIDFIMKDYPYADVKVRMIFNDIETRLAAVEKKVEKKDEPKVTFKPGRIISCDFSTEVIDKKLYDKLEAKHEADSRLISEYDLEIKKLEKRNAEQNDIVCDLYSNLCTEQKERIRCEAVIEDKKRQLAESEFHVKKLKEDEERLRDKYKRMDAVLKKKYDEIDTLNKQIDSFGLTCRLYKEETNNLKSDVESWKKRYNELEYKYEKKDAECNGLEDKYRRHNAVLKSRFFDLKNVENERDHYKGLYSSKCDDYDSLLAKQLKTQKDFTFYRNAYYECCSANDDHIEKERDLKEENIKLTEQKEHYKELFHSLNHKHQKVVGEMKAWKDKYKCINDDYIGLEKEHNTVLSIKNSLEFRNKDLINENNKLRKAYNDATDNTELEGKLEAKSCRIAALEDKLRYQRANLTSLEQKLKETEEKYNDACILNKMREDVFEANIKLQKTIEAKDREISLLRAELDKFMNNEDNDYDDRWID